MVVVLDKIHRIGFRDLSDPQVKEMVKAEVIKDKKAEQLGKGPATVSKWCTNSAQPNLENLVEIAKCLSVDVSELIRKDD